MKTKFLFFIVLLCLGVSSLFAQGEETRDPNDAIITVKDYCTFLNEVAATAPLALLLKLKVEVINSNDFYDERMQGGSIMRTGLPGNYCYNLISSISILTDSFNSCISGLSWNDAIQYCDWYNHSASTSTFNLNSCTVGAAHVDPVLKSNQLTFRLVGNSCYQAVGTAVAGTTGITEMLEEVLGFAVLVEGAGGGWRGTASSHAQEELGMVNGQRVTMPAIEEEPTYYDKADQAWMTHEQIRDHWLFEEQNHALKKNAFDRAKQLLQEKESEVTERDEHFEQSRLGGVVQGLDDATQILQYIGLGFGSPAVVTQGLSLLAKRGYQGVVRIPREAAKRALEKATEALSEAKKKAEKTQKAFLHNDAQKQEQAAQKCEAAVIHHVAERLQLLPGNSTESLWHDPALQSFLTLGHDQQWIESESKKAWEKKRVYFDIQLPIQEEQGKREIAFLERAYQERSQRAQEARKQVHLLQEKLEMATQWKELVEDFSREATEELRKIITNAGNHHQRDEQVKEIQTIFEHQQAVEATIKNLEQELSSAQKKKGQVEKRANKILKAYRQEERSLRQTVERAQARAEAYHQAWRNVWSKEALPNQERLAQEAFQQAESNPAKEGWEKAVKEAQKIQELYGQLLQKTQNDSPHYAEFQKKEEEWKKQQGYAVAKVALFKLGEYNDLFLKMKKELAEPEEEETVTKKELEKAKYEVSQVMELVRPYSEEATKVLGAAIKTFSNFKNKTTRSGIIRGEAEAAKQAMQQIASSWKNEIQKIAKQVEEIFALLNPQQRTQEEVPLLPGRIMQRAGSLLIPVDGSVEIRYVSEEKEKSAATQQREKELAELTKKLNKQTAQLRQQFSKLKKERLNIEMKRQTALAEVMTKTAVQTKILQEKEAQLATEHQALKQQQGETQEAFERREVALRAQEERLTQQQRDLEESQTAAFLEIITTFEQQTATLEEREKQLLATEQTLKKQLEELTQTTKAEIEKYRLEAQEAQKQIQEAKKQAEEAAAARIVAEARVTETEARAFQAEAQMKESIQQTETAEQEAQGARERAARSDEARKAAEAKAIEAEAKADQAKAQLRDIRQEKEASEKETRLALEKWRTAEEEGKRNAEEFFKRLTEAQTAKDALNRLSRLVTENAQKQVREAKEQAEEAAAARIIAEEKATQAEARAAQAEAQMRESIQQKETAEQEAQGARERAAQSDAAKTAAEAKVTQAEAKADQAKTQLRDIRQEKEAAEKETRLALEKWRTAEEEGKRNAEEFFKRLTEVQTAKDTLKETVRAAEKTTIDQKEEEQKALEAKAAALKTEELRIAEEREALAKKAESLKALAGIELEQKAWEDFSKRLTDIMEHEKNAILQAERTESAGSIEAEHAWQEAYKAAFTLEQLWEEMIQGIDERIEKAKNLLEKHRLALEKNHAQKEREFWKQKAAEYLVKVKKLPQQQKRFNYDEKFAELRDKRAKMQKQQKEALERRDQKASGLYEKAARILGSSYRNSFIFEYFSNTGATWAYEQAVEQKFKNNQKAEEAYRKCAQAYEQQAEALARDDQAGAELQEKIAAAQRGATVAYNEAATARDRGNNQAGEVYDKSAQAYEQQAEALARSVEALTRGNQTGVFLQKEMAEVLRNAALAYNGAVEAQAKGNGQAAEAYSKSALALEQQTEALARSVEALTRGDQTGAALQKEMAEALRNAAKAYACNSDVTRQFPDKLQVVKTYRKSAQAYEQQAEALARSVEALTRGDQTGATLQKEMAEAQKGAACAYDGATRTLQTQDKLQVGETYYKCAQFYEQQAEALARSVEALTRGDQTGAALQKKMAEAQKAAARAYACAAIEQIEDHNQAAGGYRNSAQFYEQQIKALRNAVAYNEAATAQDGDDYKKAEAYRKCAQNHVQQAEALRNAANAENKFQAVNRDNLRGARHNHYAAYIKSVQAYEQQAEALAKGDQAGAELLRKIATAQEMIGDACSQAAEARAIGNYKKEEAYRKCAQNYVQQAEALARGDQAEAERQEKIGRAQWDTARLQ